VITASQIKGARAMLGLSQRDLAELASVGLATVQRIELTAEIRGSAETIWKIQTALENAGVRFIPADDTEGPGVRLKKRQR
jgi:transcriptional regulator with XRE-family HTH domain